LVERIISDIAIEPRNLFRQTMTTVAPMRAKPSAVTLPIPEFAPVIRQTLPFILTSFFSIPDVVFF
jgi:hypothetical protein